MKLSLCVQHHPSRAETTLPRLLSQLDVYPDVVSDPHPRSAAVAWRTYRECLRRTPAWASHRLVLQDDVVVCRRFAATACAALTAQPDRLVSFFCRADMPTWNANAYAHAQTAGQSWAVLNVGDWVPTVALAWPRRLIAGMLATTPADSRLADDELVGRYMATLEEACLASVPCLVDHPDDAPSIIREGPTHAGSRSAAWFVDDACGVDWSRC